MAAAAAVIPMTVSSSALLLEASNLMKVASKGGVCWKRELVVLIEIEQDKRPYGGRL
jgi:hypothetical protein